MAAILRRKWLKSRILHDSQTLFTPQKGDIHPITWHKVRALQVIDTIILENNAWILASDSFDCVATELPLKVIVGKHTQIVGWILLLKKCSLNLQYFGRPQHPFLFLKSSDFEVVNAGKIIYGSAENINMDPDLLKDLNSLSDHTPHKKIPTNICIEDQNILNSLFGWKPAEITTVETCSNHSKHLVSLISYVTEDDIPFDSTFINFFKENYKQNSIQSIKIYQNQREGCNVVQNSTNQILFDPEYSKELHRSLILRKIRSIKNSEDQF